MYGPAWSHRGATPPVGFDGWFSLGPVSNLDWKGSKRDICFCIYVENEACFVTKTFGSEKHFMRSAETIDDHCSGVFDTVIVMTKEESGSVFAAGEIMASRAKWLEIAPGHEVSSEASPLPSSRTVASD
jgi:hypothetical protein